MDKVTRDYVKGVEQKERVERMARRAVQKRNQTLEITCAALLGQLRLSRQEAGYPVDLG